MVDSLLASPLQIKGDLRQPIYSSLVALLGDGDLAVQVSLTLSIVLSCHHRVNFSDPPLCVLIQKECV